MAKKVPQSTSEFSLVSSYRLGYRNREDITNLPPGVLIKGSQNVLTDVTGRVGITKGYTLDGQNSAVLAPILSSFDWESHLGFIRHLRAGFLTTVGNDGKLQYRYVDESGVVTWRDLLTSLTCTAFNFCDYWDSTNLQAYLLFVNHSAFIYQWSGGITTFASATSNTITKEGVETWAEEGFYDTGTHSVTINGINYAATGGWGTTTLTGVTPDPTGAGIVTGDVVHQTPEATANSSATSLPTIPNDLIANLRNQIYIGSLTNNSIYVSKVNNYKDYSFTQPVRLVGEGALVTMDGPARALIPQEDYMEMHAGTGQIYKTEFILSADLTAEDFQIHRLKTSPLQATQSQALLTNMPNNSVFVSNEPKLNSLGRVDNVVLTPQITDLSYSIINDFNSYDFTDGSVAYLKNFVYVAVPKESVVRIYNMTDQTPLTAQSSPSHYWEAPLTIPTSRFSIIDGELYGHSYLTSETYKLFTGYNFNTHPIDARAVFSYQQFGDRADSKSQDEFYIEGYISTNATLNFNFLYDFNGISGQATYPLLGTETPFVLINNLNNSLGKSSLGKNPLGGNLLVGNTEPNKFRIIQTFSRLPYYEFSPGFSSVGVDFNWSILSFGPLVTLTTEGNNPIKR